MDCWLCREWAFCCRLKVEMFAGWRVNLKCLYWLLCINTLSFFMREECSTPHWIFIPVLIKNWPFTTFTTPLKWFPLPCKFYLFVYLFVSGCSHPVKRFKGYSFCVVVQWQNAYWSVSCWFFSFLQYLLWPLEKNCHAAILPVWYPVLRVHPWSPPVICELTLEVRAATDGAMVLPFGFLLFFLAFCRSFLSVQAPVWLDMQCNIR